MTGVEIDLVVSDSLKALSAYERIFEVERLEATSFSRGLNEAVFTLYGSRFHLLDENPEYQLIAPQPGAAGSVWFNVAVPDIEAVHRRAMEQGCQELQPVTQQPGFGVANSMFTDPFGYTWMLHQIYREVSFEERNRIFEEQYKSQEAAE